MSLEALERVWSDLMAEVPGAYDAKVKRVAGTEGYMFSVHSEQREGVGYVNLRLSDDFLTDVLHVEQFVSMRLRDDVASQCPFARQFLKRERASA
jgi:hypothetical protein